MFHLKPLLGYALWLLGTLFVLAPQVLHRTAAEAGEESA